MKRIVFRAVCVLGLLSLLVAGGATLQDAPDATTQGGSGGQPCGGFAGLECPSPKQVCVDDPSDDCDPKRGGADCIGICRGPGGAS